MRYSNYREYSETDKFIDDLFKEDAEISWSCDGPQDSMEPSMNITVVKQEGEAEKTYLKSLISEISEKLSEILEACETLPSERDRNTYFTKEELISRMISLSNQLDGILMDVESVSAANTMNGMSIVSGTVPTINSMF